MDEKDQPEVTRRGLFEELAGEVEEKVGELFDNEQLAAAGRDKQADAESVGIDAPVEDAADSDR